MKYVLSKFVLITNESINTRKDVKLVFSLRTGNVISLKNITLTNIISNDYSNIGKDLFEKLIRLKIIVPYNEIELNSILSQFKNNQTSDILDFVITPSSNCQLGCSYCGQTHSKYNMTLSTIKNLLCHIEHKLSIKKYKGLSVTWYGGEPLLGIKAIKEIVYGLKKICNKNQVRLYPASIITNGLNLNLKKFDELVNLGIKNFQITIDGTKDIHDKSRHTKLGHPTYDIILKNIVNIVKSSIYEEENIAINIRINVHKYNYKSIDDLLLIFKELNIHNKININMEPIHDWGKNKADKEIGLPIKKFSDLEIEWFIKMHELGFHINNFIPFPTYKTCMLTDDDAELIDAYGEILYCWEIPFTKEFDQVFVKENINNSSKFQYNLIRKHDLRNWYEEIKEKDYDCYKCKFLPVCGGSCPISWFKGNVPCPSYKYNMEERILLSYYYSQ